MCTGNPVEVFFSVRGMNLVEIRIKLAGMVTVAN